MALVHRINSNFGFVLNTLYCKCMINIKSFVTEHNFVGYSKQTGANKPMNYESFEQMINFRQNEARKCILIKIQDVRHINELEKFCSYYTNIVNIFPYCTANNESFVLMELKSVEHVAKLRNLAAFKGDIEEAQTVSPLFTFRPWRKLYSNELRNNINIYAKFQAPKPSEIRKLLEQVDSVSDQMISLHNVLRITDLNMRLRFYTADLISYYISRLFSNIKLVPFGSSVNGFGQIGCDLDLLCKIVPVTNKKYSWKKFCFISQDFPVVERNEQKELLEVLGTVMKMCIPGLVDIKKILEARVPIIKFCNSYTNMKCDLSSTNRIALQMSELLYIYGQLDWRIRPLVCTIRKWARFMNLTKEHPGQWITNFSLTLLIIFYLQTRDILPSVNTIKCFIDLSKNRNKETDPDFNWFVSWKKSIKRTNDESLHNLLFNFFEYYSIFDFKMHAICIRDGRLKQKNDLSPLYIYNPFDASLNVSKNVTSVELKRLVDNFQKAFTIMLNSAEGDIMCKLFNLESITKETNCTFNNQETQIGLEGKLFPTITNINDLKKIQGNIIK